MIQPSSLSRKDSFKHTHTHTGNVKMSTQSFSSLWNATNAGRGLFSEEKTMFEKAPGGDSGKIKPIMLFIESALSFLSFVDVEIPSIRLSK